jgi:hypothetical protein
MPGASNQTPAYFVCGLQIMDYMPNARTYSKAAAFVTFFYTSKPFNQLVPAVGGVRWAERTALDRHNGRSCTLPPSGWCADVRNLAGRHASPRGIPAVPQQQQLSLQHANRCWSCGASCRAGAPAWDAELPFPKRTLQGRIANQALITFRQEISQLLATYPLGHMRMTMGNWESPTHLPRTIIL